jgi:hypothetical protein
LARGKLSGRQSAAEAAAVTHQYTFNDVRFIDKAIISILVKRAEYDYA